MQQKLFTLVDLFSETTMYKKQKTKLEYLEEILALLEDFDIREYINIKNFDNLDIRKIVSLNDCIIEYLNGFFVDFFKQSNSGLIVRECDDSYYQKYFSKKLKKGSIDWKSLSDKIKKDYLKKVGYDLF